MKKRTLILIAGLLLIGFNVYAADGDLIVNGKVGIGTTSPGGNLEVAGQTTNVYMILNHAEDSASHKPTIAFMQARGTLASPTAVQSGDWLGQINVWGATGAGTYDSSPRKVIEFAAEETWTTSTGGFSMRVYTRPTGQSSLGPPTERMRINAAGNVGIGTASPANILTIQQASATDPIADSWTTYPCDRTTKDVIRTLPNQSGALERLLEVELYEWKRKPHVSDDEIKNQTDDNDMGVDELERRRQDLHTEKSKLPKFQARRLGVMLDDPNIPDEITTVDGAGNKGLDLVGYIGWLHATIKELALRVQQLERK